MYAQFPRCGAAESQLLSVDVRFLGLKPKASCNRVKNTPTRERINLRHRCERSGIEPYSVRHGLGVMVLLGAKWRKT